MADYNPYGKTNTKDSKYLGNYKLPTVKSTLSNIASDISMVIPVTAALKIGTTLWKGKKMISSYKASMNQEVGKKIIENNQGRDKALAEITTIAKAQIANVHKSTNVFDKFPPSTNPIVLRRRLLAKTKVNKKIDTISKDLVEHKGFIYKSTDIANKAELDNLRFYLKKAKWEVGKKKAGSVVGDVLGSYAAYKYVDGKIK